MPVKSALPPPSFIKEKKKRIKKKEMADVARTRAYSRKNSSSQEAVARRHRRNQMRSSREGAAAEGDAVQPSEEEELAGEDRSEQQEGGGAPVLGIPVAAAPLTRRGSGRPPVPASFRRPAHAAPVVEWRSVVPVAGAVAVAGRQRQMEDALTIWMHLCSPQLNRGLPVHYFGVYDGHGGSHFSMICKQKMHEILKEELMGAPPGRVQIGAADPWGQPPPPPGMITDESLLQETWRIVMNRVFARVEMVGLRPCKCASEGFRCGCGCGCGCEMSSLTYSGTTAVAVVLTENHLVVGNCGDSRAVLYRAGRIIPLSFDHKPERADEKARIEASGGRVLTTDAPRVEGILAMSRAIGDVFLKPFVISEPDVTFTRRDEEDEFVIVASDGMWDVIPTDMAGRVVGQCLREPASLLPEPNISCQSASAAALLTRLALARCSIDNISVVVVDLKGGRAGDN